MTEDLFHAASTPPPENGSSFTALLGLPANQAMELLQDEKSFISISSPTFPSNKDLADRAARFSVFAADSPEMTHFPSISSERSNPISSERSNQTFADPVTPDLNRRSMKRNVKEKKGKESAKKKLKTEEGQSEDSKKIPYVHVRARRGQATASHSLAERVRREKINVRMKLLQELVPGCSKISGTVLVLDEIINHVQALQRQVELLSMKLAAVNSQIECNVDSLFSRKACELSSDGCSTVRMVNLSSLVGSSIMRPETQISDLMEHHQQLWHLDASQPPLAWETEENRTCITSMEDSASGQTLSMNPANAIPNQLKTEL